MMVKTVLLLLGFACVKALSELVDAPWHVGVGIADCTGPAAEVVMMGYADNNHKTAGIHMRLYARAFVFVDPSSRDRMAFVNVDTWAATEAVIQGVHEKLHAWFQGRYYSRNNLIIAGSHTHHGPAGASAYMLFQFSSNGRVQQSLDALIDGISEAVWLAHHDVRPAEIFIGNGMVDNSTVPNCPMPNCASRNRSPTSFLMNPEQQRKKYFGDDNVDRNMDLLKIVDAKTGKAMGSLNWFAVHPTSMTSDYHLISGDNKGYAAYAFEQEMNGPTWVQPAGRGPFVAGFVQGVSGDISPNTRGVYCKNTGESCENQWSVCWENGQPKNELCLGQGPGRDKYESMKIIGERQVTAAKTIFERATEPLGTGISHVLRYVETPQHWFEGILGVGKRDFGPEWTSTVLLLLLLPLLVIFLPEPVGNGGWDEFFHATWCPPHIAAEGDHRVGTFYGTCTQYSNGIVRRSSGCTIGSDISQLIISLMKSNICMSGCCQKTMAASREDFCVTSFSPEGNSEWLGKEAFPAATQRKQNTT